MWIQYLTLPGFALVLIKHLIKDCDMWWEKPRHSNTTVVRTSLCQTQFEYILHLLQKVLHLIANVACRRIIMKIHERCFTKKRN